MCCNTKPGPRAAIAFFRKKTGIHVTQADWHKIRKAAEVNLGHKLSNRVADSHEAALVAAAFADSLDATPEEKKAIIFELSEVRTTEGNIEAVRELTNNGLPAEVVNKRRRMSDQQRAIVQREVEEAEADWDERGGVWNKAEIKAVGMQNYPASARAVDDEMVYVEHEPNNKVDPNAMRIRNSSGEMMGYLPAAIAARVLQETGETEFAGHISGVRQYDGKTVGFDVKLDRPVPAGYLDGMLEVEGAMLEAWNPTSPDNLPED